MEKKKALERSAHCGACAYYLTKPPRRQEIHSVPSRCSWRRSEKSLRRGVMQPDSTERRAPFASTRWCRACFQLSTALEKVAGRTDGGQAGRDAYDDRRTRRELTSQDGWARTRWTPCVRATRPPSPPLSVSPGGNQLRSGFQSEWRKMVHGVTSAKHVAVISTRSLRPRVACRRGDTRTGR